jgi:selenium-binding protein 1
MVEDGLDPQDLLGRRFGHHLNFWSMSERRLTQRVDLGDAHQLVLEDLSGSVWLWYRDGDRWTVRKVITVPAEPADPDLLPPALQPFGAVPPLICDLDLSVDDRWLYVSCWGTGELKQYDISDLRNPVQTGSVRLGGIVGRQPHPAAPEVPLGGGPQMVEVSRDGRRVYVTNSLYGGWDDSFYPQGVGAWMAKLDTDPDRGGLAANPRFFPNGDHFGGLRVHQTRLEGGDASSDSYCHTR